MFLKDDAGILRERTDAGIFVPTGHPVHVNGSGTLSEEAFGHVMFLIEFSGQIPDCIQYMTSRGPLSPAQECAIFHMEAEDCLTNAPLTGLSPFTKALIDRWWWDL
jgi:hypothetical protein